MSSDSFAKVLPVIFRELVHGSPDPSARTYVLNQGDLGLLASLDRLSAVAASASHDGGASIAAHVDHLRYGLSLLNRWADGVPPPWPDMDFTAIILSASASSNRSFGTNRINRPIVAM